jgi:hypothetical protein
VIRNRIKSVLVSSIVLATISCTNSLPNNTKLSPQENFQDLDKEYIFTTKALTKLYLARKLKKWLDWENETPDVNSSKLIKELSYAKYKYAETFCEIINDPDNTGLLETINDVNEVSDRSIIDIPFRNFLNSCSPPLNTILVNVNAIGNNNGSSWDNAYTSLQSALTAATSGQDIWVASGTYKPGIQITDAFQLKSGVNVYGGFAGDENNLSQRQLGTYETILSGDINNDNIANNGDCYHVLKGANNSTLDGVTIKFGFANGSQFGVDDSGGGIYNDNSSPNLTNLIIANNSASFNGGGMINNNNSSPNLVNVVFTNNFAINNGGGVININNNSPINMTNVTFSNDTAANGGIMLNLNSSVIIKNSILWGTLYNINSTINLGYSDVKGGFTSFSGAILKDLNDVVISNDVDFINAHNIGGNIVADDPLFVNSDNLRIQADSPARNSGTNTGAPITDIVGTNRPQEDITDMGAYEFIIPL